jgi:hypothetical protein
VNNVPVGAVPAAPRGDGGVASGSASVRSTNARSAGDEASGWSASTRTKNPRVATGAGGELDRLVLEHGHRVLVLPPARQRRQSEARGHAARARRETMQRERVGRAAGTTAERADDRPRMAAAHGQVLPHGEHRPTRRMRERRVVDVLAHVVLVHAHRAVGRERQVLHVDQVDDGGGRAGVLERHVPEPRRRVRCERERRGEADAAPFAAHGESLRVEVHRGRTARPEERRRLDHRPMSGAERRWRAHPRSRSRGTD